MDIYFVHVSMFLPYGTMPLLELLSEKNARFSASESESNSDSREKTGMGAFLAAEREWKVVKVEEEMRLWWAEEWEMDSLGGGFLVMKKEEVAVGKVAREAIDDEELEEGFLLYEEIFLQ